MADPENAGKTKRSEDVDKGHGRIGIRGATVRHDVDALQDPHHWPGLQAVGQVTATREIKGERSTETRFFPIGGRLGPERFLTTVRPHRVLDVTMGGDALQWH